MNFIKCEKLEKSMAELQFSIDAEAFKGAVADVFKKEGKKYSVPGFRKGKVSTVETFCHIGFLLCLAHISFLETVSRLGDRTC